MDSITDTTMLQSLDEVAKQLRCNRRSVERQIATNQLDIVRIGRAVRVERRAGPCFIRVLDRPMSEPPEESEPPPPAKEDPPKYEPDQDLIEVFKESGENTDEEYR